MSIVRVESAAKWWEPGTGLHPVSLTIAAGEFLVVRGRSGSGKSTLLALLAGWANPDEGSVTHDVADSTQWPRTAVVPQVLALAPELTVREHAQDALTGLGLSRAERDARVDEALAAFDLTELADRLPGDTSMGQQQRTALARAAVVRPRLLLADEPTSHQDAGHVATVVEQLRRLTGSGTAVMVTSHDPVVADAAHRILDL